MKATPCAKINTDSGCSTTGLSHTVTFTVYIQHHIIDCVVASTAIIKPLKQQGTTK